MIHSNKGGKCDNCNYNYYNNAVPARSAADGCNVDDSCICCWNCIHNGPVAYYRYHVCRVDCYRCTCYCIVVDVHLTASGRLTAFENKSVVPDRVAFAGLPVLPA